MQGQPVLAGTLTSLLITLVVLALGIGFRVELTQALSQALPLIVVGGVVVALATLVLRRELV